MLELVLLIVFGVVAFRTVTTLRRESAIFAEFKQPHALVPLVLLFPLGPLFLLASPFVPFPLAHVAAAGCYLPALVTASRQARVFGSAGTDRVQRAQSAIAQAFGAALAGLLYVTVASLFILGARAIG